MVHIVHFIASTLYLPHFLLFVLGETPHPVTDLEYIFTVTDFLVGVLIFATIVGNVGSMISNINHDRGVFNQKIDAVKRFVLKIAILRWKC